MVKPRICPVFLFFFLISTSQFSPFVLRQLVSLTAFRPYCTLSVMGFLIGNALYALVLNWKRKIYFLVLYGPLSLRVVSIQHYYGLNIFFIVSCQLMALLLLRHALSLTNAEGDDDASTFFSVSRILVFQFL